MSESEPLPSKYPARVPLLLHEASIILKKLSKGGSFNSLIYNNRVNNPQGLAAIVSKASQYRSLIDRILESTRLLTLERDLDEWLTRILISQLCFKGRRLSGQSRPVRCVLKHKKEILEALKTADICNVRGLSQTRVQKPRYVRVNTLKISTDDFVKVLKYEGYGELVCPPTYDGFLQLVNEIMIKKRVAEVFVRDFHVKDMLVFPAGTFFQDHRAYSEGWIVLQDKASCLQSCCVQPPLGSVILDMCAAPGMKTSLYAAMIQNTGKIYAIEMSKYRFKDMVKILGSLGVTCATLIHDDAGTVGPNLCQNVEYIVVDPSCSGTGMSGRAKVEDLETQIRSSVSRTLKLQNLQTYLLKHALSNFSSARCVVYSTCALDAQENEEVVARALRCAQLNGFELVDLSRRLRDWKHFGSADFDGGERCVYTRPDKDMMNGGFFAVFERSVVVKEEEEEEEEGEEEEVELSEQLFVRINTLKITIDSAIQCFVDNGWHFRCSPENYKLFDNSFRSDQEGEMEKKFFKQDFYIKELLVFPRGLKDSLTEEFISENKFILEDKVSCLAVHLLDPQPGSVVLNLSAFSSESATSYIAARMQNRGRIYAYDAVPCHSRRLANRLQKKGVTCAEIVQDSGLNSCESKCPKVRSVLVLPPSSSESGATHTNKLLVKNKNSPDQFVSRQFSLLRHALSAFPHAKRIVYATKSANPMENEEIIDALLVFAKFQGYGLVDAVAQVEGWVNGCVSKYHCSERCLMAKEHGKGLFVAVFERNDCLKASELLHSQMKGQGELEGEVQQLSKDLAESADVPKSASPVDSASMSESADVPRSASLVDSASVSKSADVPSSAFATDSAFVSSSANVSGCTVVSKSADVSEFPGKLEILDSSMSADVPKSALVSKSAVQKARLAANKQVEMNLEKSSLSRAIKLQRRKDKRAAKRMAKKEAMKIAKQQVKLNPNPSVFLGDKSLDLPRYTKFLQQLKVSNLLELAKDSRSASLSESNNVANVLQASAESAFVTDSVNVSESTVLSKSADVSEFSGKLEILESSMSSDAPGSALVSKSALLKARQAANKQGKMNLEKSSSRAIILQRRKERKAAKKAAIKMAKQQVKLNLNSYEFLGDTSVDLPSYSKFLQQLNVSNVLEPANDSRLASVSKSNDVTNSAFVHKSLYSSRSSEFVNSQEPWNALSEGKKYYDRRRTHHVHQNRIDDSNLLNVENCQPVSVPTSSFFFVVDREGTICDRNDAECNGDNFGLQKKNCHLKMMNERGKMKRKMDAGRGAQQSRYFKARAQFNVDELDGKDDWLDRNKSFVGKRNAARFGSSVDSSFVSKSADFLRFASPVNTSFGSRSADSPMSASSVDFALVSADAPMAASSENSAFVPKSANVQSADSAFVPKPLCASGHSKLANSQKPRNVCEKYYLRKRNYHIRQNKIDNSNFLNVDNSQPVSVPTSSSYFVIDREGMQ